MANSLELRVPFLDYRLMNYSTGIDSKFKTTIFNKKIILKKVAERYVGKDIINRRKQGFAAPVEIWMRKKVIEHFSKVIDFEFIGKFLSHDDVYKNIDLFLTRKKIELFRFIHTLLFHVGID